jgi:hypothetical protein
MNTKSNDLHKIAKNTFRKCFHSVFLACEGSELVYGTQCTNIAQMLSITAHSHCNALSM